MFSISYKLDVVLLLSSCLTELSVRNVSQLIQLIVTTTKQFSDLSKRFNDTCWNQKTNHFWQSLMIPTDRFLAYNIQTLFLKTIIHLLYTYVENLPKKEKENYY